MDMDMKVDDLSISKLDDLGGQLKQMQSVKGMFLELSGKVCLKFEKFGFSLRFWIQFLVFNATFSNISAISWRPVLVVVEVRVPGENHRPWASNW